jgi:hypothetical protein
VSLNPHFLQWAKAEKALSRKPVMEGHGYRSLLPLMYETTGTKPLDSHQYLLVARPSEYYRDVGKNIIVSDEVGKGSLLAGDGAEVTADIEQPIEEEVNSQLLSEEKRRAIVSEAQQAKEEASKGPLEGPLKVGETTKIPEEDEDKLSGEGASSQKRKKHKSKRIKTTHCFTFN